MPLNRSDGAFNRSTVTNRTPPTNVDGERQFSCSLCERPDNDEMVQCDHCDQWSHYICANVTNEVENQDWLCTKCGTVEQPPQKQSIASSTLSKVPPVITNITNNVPPPKFIEDKGNNVPPPRFIEDKGDIATRRSVCSSSRSAKAKKLALERLEEERALREKRIAQQEAEEREYIARKYAILDRYDSDEQDSNGESIDETDKLQRTENWMQSSAVNRSVRFQPQPLLQPSNVHDNECVHSFDTSAYQPPMYPSVQSTNASFTSVFNSARPTTSAASRNVAGNLISSTVPLQSTVPSGRNATQPNAAIVQQLSNTQIAARHVMAKDLPQFSGKAEEWPLFISSYETASRACGFSNDENMIRLQRSLKGKALDAVRSMLLLPATVPQAVNTLRMLYGRPEIIIQTLLQKIRLEPAPKADKLESLVTYALAVQNLCSTIESSGLVAHLANPLLLQELTDKLPAQIKLNWAMFRQTQAAVNVGHFSGWLFQVAEAVREVTLPTLTLHESEVRSSGANHQTKARLNVHNANQRKPENTCPVCNGQCKAVHSCEKFKKLSHTDKWNAVKRQRLCRKCLGVHSQFQCKIFVDCGYDGCQLKHHKLLHNVQKQEKTSKSCKVESQCNTHQMTNKHIMFRVVPVTLHGKRRSIDTYAFLDEGSSLSLLEHQLAEELELGGTPESLCLKWTANTVRVENNSRRVNLQISSTQKVTKKYKLADVRTVKSLNLPVQSLEVHSMAIEYPHLRNIPIQPYTNAVPRLLIGLDNWRLGLPLEFREGKPDQPVGTRTRLGWSIHGVHPQNQHQQNLTIHGSYHMCDCNVDSTVHKMVQEFFTSENFGVRVPERSLESRDDVRARQLLEKTTTVDKNQFTTGLLWKYDEFTLPDSYSMAKRRLVCLENKMLKDPNLRDNMTTQIQSYVAKGYARKVSRDDISNPASPMWYLPIFAVKNPSKPNKFRMVFDAAATVNGISLNSMLLKGPDQLTSLPVILFKLREKAIAICGDIQEMFLQVGIRPADQNAQRFLWRDGDSSKKPDVYVMQVMTFGATCSPCTAQYIKNRNATKWANKFPKAAHAIIHHHYVDDFLDSADTEQEAIALALDVKFVHSQAHFHIRNWISNSTKVLSALQDAKATISDVKSFDISTDLTMEKVLGMFWCTQSDTFTYSLKFNKTNAEVLNGRRPPTKREVLRTLMSIFDPLGLLSSFLIYVKILMQDIWRTSIEWDEPITGDIFERWLVWISLLPQLENLHLPRCYSTKLSSAEAPMVQLHVFVDASENAFAAAAYLRIQSESGVECILVAGKSRVAPQKPMTIPRLELQAALLGARLANTISENHAITISRRYIWSDSKTVLYWLRSDPRNFKQFVAFRIGEILETTQIDEWRWVPGKQNVADEATKWQKVPEFNQLSRWFSGPNFLFRKESEWPVNPINTNVPNDTEEVKHCCHLHLCRDIPVTPIDVHRFSNWSRLVRAQAYVGRFVANLIASQHNSQPQRGPLEPEELNLAERELFKRAQFEGFPEEIRLFYHNKEHPNEEPRKISKTSKIYRLSAYLDEHKVVRMQGRIDAAAFADFNTKRPILLPCDHYITRLMVDHYHRRFHHLNAETVVNELRQTFYIAKLRVVVNKSSRNCQTCKNRNAQPKAPEMAVLPVGRLSPFNRAFSYIGIDYFGPMLVSVGRRTEKRWGVLITCLTVRAVHIEVAHSLTTDSCIMAIRNFMGRRGMPLQIHSDNGTNFRGADNELQRAILQLHAGKLHETFTALKIKWVFNPPASPHMGGSWERLVGSVKKILYQIMPRHRNPSDEVLRNLLIEVEDVVNSRPLTYVPIDPDNEEALTPNHFLKGSSNGSKPPGAFNDSDLALRKNWRIVQQLTNSFWKRWVREYLPTLTRRTKWFDSVKPLAKGDIVVVVDETSPRNCWPMGRILETTAGRSGHVRQAVVQTATGVFTRPAVRLALLDVIAKEDGKSIEDHRSTEEEIVAEQRLPLQEQ